MSGDPARRACTTPVAGGTLLALTVQPNARRTEAAGQHDGMLRVRLAAPPIEGRANDALIAWLAGQLGLAKRDVVLRRGSSSRHKQVLLACEVTRVAQWLDAACAHTDAGPPRR